MSSTKDEYEPEKTVPGTISVAEVPKAAGRPFVLELIRGPGSPQTFTLDRPYLVIGRLPTADLSVDSAELSRQHLRLVRAGNEFSCEDMNSRNGVFLNGVKIHSAVLREGDQIQLGDLVFIYHEGR